MKPFTKALFVINENDQEQKPALEKALSFCGKMKIPMHFICVLPDLAPLHYSNSVETLTMIRETIRNETVKRLQNTLNKSSQNAGHQIKVVFGKEHYLVISEVIKHEYDLVIKSAEDPSWLDSVVGSEDLHLLRKCPCGVWLINQSRSVKNQRIAAAIDFSDDDIESDLNAQIANTAAAFSQFEKTQMHLLTVYDPSLAGFASAWADNPEKFEKEFLEVEERRKRFACDYTQKQLSESLGPDLQTKAHIIKGYPKSVIPALVKSEKIDLLVMGTIGRSGVMGLLIGNTAEAILLQLSCSILALKPKDFVSPIHP